jgi:hypothetical protein
MRHEADLMADLTTMDFFGTIVAAVLTVMVLSYLVGDNVLFRIATYLFIGVAAGYAGSIAWHHVIFPGLIEPLFTTDLGEIFTPTTVVTLLAPWFLALMLLLKMSNTTARYGSLPVAILVGVGAAVIVGGGITGTIIPQSRAAMETLDPFAQAPLTGETGFERMANVLIMLVGTISTLIYFRFSARRGPSGEALQTTLSRVVSSVGRVFIAMTFGVMYAGALAATMIVFAERVQFLRDVLSMLIEGT